MVGACFDISLSFVNLSESGSFNSMLSLSLYASSLLSLMKSSILFLIMVRSISSTLRCSCEML